MKKNMRVRAWKYMVSVLVFVCFLLAGCWKSLQCQIPDQLLVAAEEESVELVKTDKSRESVGLLKNFLPEWIEEKTVEAGNTSNIECSLFGVLPLKEVQVEVVERQSVIPGGVPVGIYMKTDGVLVVGTAEVCDLDGNLQMPVGEILQSGDYILEVNGVAVFQKEEVVEQINLAADNQVKIKVLRNGETIELICPVVQTGAEQYKAGIWIRDDTQGIGTLTYVEEDGSFGALGHGISDIDTSTLLSLEGGTLYQAEIKSIVKGEDGVPGELAGVIRYRKDLILGQIEENTEIGIFGTLTEEIEELADAEPVEIGYKQEIETGKASILSAVSGEVKEYEIEIEKVNLNSSDANKSMVIWVTDPELLELTGGIVQGMSGSPILQNGRLIGAVTHVFVNDAAKGYGIFIENMLGAEE